MRALTLILALTFLGCGNDESDPIEVAPGVLVTVKPTPQIDTGEVTATCTLSEDGKTCSCVLSECGPRGLAALGVECEHLRHPIVVE